MHIIAQDTRLRIRKMEATETDFSQYLKWMTDPETMRFWEGMTVHFTYERVVETYRENLKEEITPCIIEYEGKPLGYCQFCVLDAELFEVPEVEYARFAKPSDTVYGVDIFLGEVALRDKGLGTKSLTLLVGALFETYHADLVMIDPKVHNTRAIRCYEKSGFEPYFTVPHRELQDGIYHDSLIMGVRNPKSGFEP